MNIFIVLNFFLFSILSFGQVMLLAGFHGSSADKESSCNVGDPSSISTLGKYPREWIGYSLQYSCFPGGSDGKEFVFNAGILGLILWLGESPGRGYGNTLQYSCLENSTDRGSWRVIVHGVSNSWTGLSD